MSSMIRKVNDANDKHVWFRSLKKDVSGVNSVLVLFYSVFSVAGGSAPVTLRK
jgi:hypothetical protein